MLARLIGNYNAVKTFEIYCLPLIFRDIDWMTIRTDKGWSLLWDHFIVWLREFCGFHKHNLVRFACLLYQKSIPDCHLTGLINFLQEGPPFSKNYTWDDLQLWLDAEMSGNNLEEELDLRLKEDKRKKMDLEVIAFQSLQGRGRGQVRRRQGE